VWIRGRDKILSLPRILSLPICEFLVPLFELIDAGSQYADRQTALPKLALEVLKWRFDALLSISILRLNVA